MPESHRPTEPAFAVTYGHTLDMAALFANQPVRTAQLAVRVWKSAQEDSQTPVATVDWLEAAASDLEEAGIRPGSLIVLERDLYRATKRGHEPRYCRVRELLGIRGTKRLVHVNWLYATFGTVHNDHAPEALKPHEPSHGDHNAGPTQG